MTDVQVSGRLTLTSTIVVVDDDGTEQPYAPELLAA